MKNQARSDKVELEKGARELLSRLGLGSLALILAIGDGIMTTMDAMLEGKRLTIGRAYSLGLESKSFKEYYDELKNFKENNARVTLCRLQQKGLVEKKKKKLKLTGLGLKFYTKIKGDLNDEEGWDQKWRIIMFDIPEKIRREREWFKNELYFLGYKPMQKSVFIGKLPLSEELFREINRRRLKNYINLVTVGEIDDEEILNSFD